ncbi:molybdopterin-dependent oxidoreductase, partial [[Ruminococcus] torques]|uniref:molybdopterin cofactor-binding domain-containing protein n=1 Tax=[Ruminococcus] torques TaxID=33039 RepID=UPI001EDE0216
KWIEDRFEHLQATTHSRAIETRMEIGYDDQGLIQAVYAKVTLDIGGYVFTSGTITPEIATANIIQGYKCL